MVFDRNVNSSSTSDRNEPTGKASKWDQFLVVLIAFTAVYAIALVVAGSLVGEHVFDRFEFGPTNGSIAAGAPAGYVRFIYGVLGSVIVGWMALVAVIALGPFRQREPWAWWAMLSSVAVWFVIDTTMSLALGWPTHAAFNVPFGAALATPIMALRPRFDF